MADNYNDITSTGPVGLKGLPSLQEQRRLANKKRVREFLDQEKAFINSGRLTPVKVSNRYAAQPVENVGLEAAQYGVGQSTYDQYALASRVDDLKNVRGEQQSGLLQFANGLVKMQTTAATTFLDNMFGLLWGVGEYAVGKITGNPKKDLLSSLWNNSFTNAMADFTEKMEKWVPNYTTDYEDNLPFYSKMFGYGAGNFWGNDILKNAGFTVGAAASIAATSALMGPMGGAAGIANTLGKLGKAGKFADRMVKTFISTIGESSLEALNTYRDNEKAMLLGLNQRVNEIQDQIEFEYQQNLANGMDQVQAETIRNQRTAALIEQVKQYKDQQHSELLDASNGVFGANMAILGITNRISLGSLIKGGYGNAKSLMELAEPMVNGKLATSTKDIARGMLDGTLSFNAKAVKHGAAKVAGKAALIGASEGFLEEGSQNLASGTATINTQARMNKWARENTELGTMLNPAAEESLVDLTKALGKAWEDNFGAANGRGWTEVAAGFITGVLGVPFLKRNAQGKIRPSWQGGLAEAYESIYGQRDAVQRQIDLTQAIMGSDKFGKNVKNAIANIVINSKQNQALQDDDLREYKNGEIEALFTNAIHARDIGYLDGYLGMYDEMASGLTEDDVQELRALTADMEEGKSFVEHMTTEELQKRYQDKAARTKEKIERALEEYDKAKEQYKGKFDGEFENIAFDRIGFKNTLLWDTKRRKDKLNKEVEELQKKSDKTVSDYKEINDKKRGVKALERQEEKLTQELENIKNDPEGYEAVLKKEAERYERRKNYMEAQKVVEDYKNATTLKDIIDIYDLSPADTRDDTLETVIDSLPEGESKERLSRFKEFIDDTNSVKYLIDKYYGVPEEYVDKETLSDYEKAKYEDLLVKAQSAKSWAHAIIRDMLSEDTPIDSMDTFRERFDQRLQELIASRDEYKEKKGSLQRTKTGSIRFSEALKNGEITTDDLVFGDDGKGGDAIIGWADRVDEMVNALAMYSYYNEMVGVLNKVKKDLKNIDSIRDEVKAAKKAYREAEKAASESIIVHKSEGIPLDEMEDEEGDEESEESEEPEESEEESEEKGEEKKPERKPKRKVRGAPSEEEVSDIPAIKEYLATLGTEFALFKGTFSNGSPYYLIRKNGSPLGFEDRGLMGILEVEADKYKEYNKLMDLLGQLEEAEEGAEKDDLFNQVIDAFGRTAVLDDVFNYYKDKIEEHLKKKGKTPPKATKATAEETKKRKHNPTTTSMKGTKFPKYRTMPLKGEKMEGRKKVKIPVKQALKHTYTAKGLDPLYPWLEDQGLDPQNATDFFLHYVIAADKGKSVDKSTPIYYLGYKTSDKKQQYIEDAVFLGIKKKDLEKQGLIQALEDRKLDQFVKVGREEYLIVGTFGWDEATDAGTKEMFETVSAKIQELKDADNVTDKWVVSTTISNRIKDLAPGELVNTFKDKETRTVYNVAELLESSETNPNNLEAEDLRFAVIQGSIEAPNIVFTPGFNEETDDWYDLSGDIYPGQVYMYIPDTNGKYLPIMIETSFFNDISWTEDNPLYKEIKKKIKVLVDRNTTEQDKVLAISELRRLLIFSEQENIHYNEPGAQFNPNTIRITSNTGDATVINLEEPSPNIQEDINKVLTAIKQVNPRIQLSTKGLADTSQRKIYLKSGVLRTDIACLGTVNSQLFLYPVGNDGKYIKNERRKQDISFDRRKGKNSSAFFNGERYIKNSEEEWEDSTGTKIYDRKMIKFLNNLLAIQYGDQTLDIPVIEERKKRYYVFDNDVYVAENGHKGFQLLSGKKVDQILKKIEDKGKTKKKSTKMKSLVDFGISPEEVEGGTSPQPKKTSKRTAQEQKTPKKQKKGTYGEYFNFPTSSKVTVQSWSKITWGRPGDTLEQPTVRIYLRGQQERGYFEIAKSFELDNNTADYTNNSYRIAFYAVEGEHYSTSDINTWLEAVAAAIPEGGIITLQHDIESGHELTHIEADSLEGLKPYGFLETDQIVYITHPDTTPDALGRKELTPVFAMQKVKTAPPSRTQRGQLRKQAEEKNKQDKDFEEWKNKITFVGQLRKMGRNLKSFGDALATALGVDPPSTPANVNDLLFDFIKKSDSIDFTKLDPNNIEAIIDNVKNCLHMK